MKHRLVRGTGRTLLLLHSTGGDENQLLDLGRMLDPEASLLSPRGQIEEDQMPRFFKRLAEGVFDMDDLRERTLELAAWVDAVQASHGLGPLTAVGYSNGANMAVSLMLARPQLLRGAVLFRAMLPYEVPAPPDLTGRRALLLAGQADRLVPAGQVERLEAVLRGAGATVDLDWQPAGHGLGAGDLDAARDWLSRN